MVAVVIVVNARQGGVIPPNRGPQEGGGARPGDEFALIERLRARFEAVGGAAPSGQVWIGDDAAVVPAGPGPYLLLATDLVVGGVHVDLAYCDLDDLGYKALMVTASDLAAMGARPDYVLVSVAAPTGTDVERLSAGVAEAAGEAGCVVVGGDLSSSPALVVSVSVAGSLHGSAEPGPMLRSGARPGDAVVVTGPQGASAAGLRLLRQGTVDAGAEGAGAAAIRAHRRPVARLDEGEVARLAGATAAIDVSDGLVADVRHLAAASGVGVDLDTIPAAPGSTAEEALGGGEEYELLITTGDLRRLERAMAAADLRPPLPIGACSGVPGRLTLAGSPLPEGGWRHRFG